MNRMQYWTRNTAIMLGSLAVAFALYHFGWFAIALFAVPYGVKLTRPRGK